MASDWAVQWHVEAIGMFLGLWHWRRVFRGSAVACPVLESDQQAACKPPLWRWDEGECAEYGKADTRPHMDTGVRLELRWPCADRG